MKNNLKKLVLILLAFCLCIPLFSCKKKEKKPEDVLASYGDYYVTDSLYTYWLSKYKYHFLTTYNNGVDEDEFWDSLIDDDTTYEEYIVGLVENEVMMRTVALSLFDEYGLDLDAAKVKAIDDDINDKIENVGSRKEMNEELGEKFGMNIDMLREVYIINKKYDMVCDYLYGSNGRELPTEKEMAEYYNDNYNCLKLITVFSNYTPERDENGEFVYDENGEIEKIALTDQEKEEKLLLIDEITSELDGGTDFEDCIAKYSEVDYSLSPNGILVSAGDSALYGSDIIKASRELEVGDYDVLTDDLITMIVKKYELPAYTSLTEDEIAGLDSFSDRVANKKRTDKFDKLIKDVLLDAERVKDISIREISRNSYY
ncbi:MAG: hypothetical protein E7652_06500 [Ruminococcaceae bacterium]|nr:hypothetical protein [Oscillospiraceae bacterium]